MKNHIIIIVLTLFVSATDAQQSNTKTQSEKGIAPLKVVSNQSSIVSNTYAVVVGISDYQDPGIPDLRFADKDAEAFANYLSSDAGGKLDVDHLKVLLNEKATVAQFAIALDWLMEVVKENDQVIIYFSGHGDVEKKTITQPGYLLCWDAPARVYLAGGALALPMFQDIITTLSAQNKAKVIVVTDACRSGKLAGSSVGGSQITGANLAKQYSNEIKILSCQPNEYSIEGEQWGGGRGAFSYHLVDALYGMADNNNDLIVNLQEAGRYIEDHVSSEVSPVSQVPMVLGNRTDVLSKVNVEILAAIKSGKSSQTMMLSAIDTKGIEEDVLSMVDTSVRMTYKLFKQALKDKIFLGPDNACADTYYEQLIKEPKLERLHSTIKEIMPLHCKMMHSRQLTNT
ncbi:MAG: caspase family protein [Saprospiraceae bacterium]|nr:caspase family protein [Saprospiraceae bacterium]